MVSKMSLAAQKTSPTLVGSPSSASFHEHSGFERWSPSRRGETLLIRKKRSAVEGIINSEGRGTNLEGISEESSMPPADSMTAIVSSERNAASLSKRRGYRPLSVKIGEAFNPFSTRGSNLENLEMTQGSSHFGSTAAEKPRRGLELSKKVNWTENVNPNIFNANFIATMTSKCGSLSTRLIKSPLVLTKHSNS